MIRSRSATVIGGGIGGLTAAALLARAGVSTRLLERNARVGGKMSRLQVDGFSWDMGPSLLTMPDVLRETWELAGREFPLDLVRLDSTCRYHWEDGTIIDEDETFWNRPDVARFLRYAAGLWEISEDTFLRNDIRDVERWFKPRNLAALVHLPKIASAKTLAQTAAATFSDPHIRQIFLRFATYNGSSPYRTPAAFNIIAYVQAKFGGWYVRGGMHRVAEELAVLGQSLGVEIETDADVESVAAPEGEHAPWKYRIAGGEEQPTGGIVCNQDVLSAHEHLLPAAFRERFRKSHLDRLELSTSGFVMFLGVDGSNPALQHHNIFFSADYPQEFREMFDEHKPASSPTIYVAINSRTDSGRAPAGSENWFVLVNAPALAPGVSWPEIATEYGNRIIGILERQFGLADLSKRVRVRRDFTPLDFATTHRALGGSLYGFASHGMMTAFRRPPITLPGVRRFHFAGGTTHPGGGVPLAMLSGRIAARKLEKELR